MPVDDHFCIDWTDVDFNDPKAVRILVQHLANLVEALYQENGALKAENQKLKDEINRLKGEKGRPQIKPSSSAKKADLQKIKKPEKEWKKESKLDRVIIDQTKVIRYEGVLPDDAWHKGYRSVVVQGIVVKSNNIEYRLERYYSPSEGKLYEASLPFGIEGEFDPSVKSWVLFWYFSSRMSEGKIHQMLTDIGIRISEGEISTIITKGHDQFHQEKKEIIKAGLQSSPYQHIDDTGARVKGINQHFSVLCNDYFSAFFITEKKDRLTILSILSQEEEICFLMNPYTLQFLKERGLKRSLIPSLTPLLALGAVKKGPFEERTCIASS